MDCPYCTKEMREGAIISSRERVCWREKGEDDWIATECVKLSGSPMFDRARAVSFYCADCKMVITPVPELGDDLLTTLIKKADTVASGFKARLEQDRAEREEEKEEKRREQRRRKDPWED